MNVVAELRSMSERLALIHSADYADAEDALQDAGLELLVSRPEEVLRPFEEWQGLLWAYARKYLRHHRSAMARFGATSLDAMVEEDWDALAFVPIYPAVAHTRAGVDEEARHDRHQAHTPWTRRQMVGAAQRFRDRTGRAPSSRDFDHEPDLPPLAQVRREFGSPRDLLLEAGVPAPAPRSAAMTPLDAARACERFRWREGYWPSGGDAERLDCELPCLQAMVRCFGGTTEAKVRDGSLRILAEEEAGQAAAIGAGTASRRTPAAASS